MSNEKSKNLEQLKGTVKLTKPTRLWFLGRGFKQVPPELIDGKILWAHPDGYFVNQYGRKLVHSFAASYKKQVWRSSNGIAGTRYPYMSHFGNKACHILICSTFHGPRPEGYQCDHLNGNILDYSAVNLEWVTPKENYRRAKILRALRKAGRDPKTIPYDELRAIIKGYDVFSPERAMQRSIDLHFEF